MKEILNTLYEIEDTAKSLLSSTEAAKKDLRDQYSKEYETYKHQLEKPLNFINFLLIHTSGRFIYCIVS